MSPIQIDVLVAAPLVASAVLWIALYRKSKRERRAKFPTTDRH